MRRMAMELKERILENGCPSYYKHARITCEICEEEEELQNLIPHLATHTGVSNCLICIKCEERFPDRAFFYRHMTAFHAARINCRFCTESSFSKEWLFMHVRKVHGNIKKLMFDNPQHASHLDDLHMAKKAAEKKRSKRHNEKQNQKEDCRICHVCGKTFQKNYLRDFHMKTHTREEPTTCDVCGKTFSTWMGLRVHKAQCHRDQEMCRYQCHICSKMFKRKHRLDEHLKRHAGFVTHWCGVCFRRYTGSYEEHVEKVHQKKGFTVVSVPSCDLCGKKFRDSDRLKRHQMTHTKERVKCEICEKLVSKSYLNLHMAFHSDKKYECEDCGKKFHRKQHLDYHRQSHTKDRPYSCDLCDKTFKLHHHMRAHRNTHKDSCDERSGLLTTATSIEDGPCE